MTVCGKRIERLDLELYFSLKQQEKEIFTRENFKMTGLKVLEHIIQPAPKNSMLVNFRTANATAMVF